MGRWLALVTLVCACGCAPAEAGLLVDVRTDWVAGVDFERVRIEVLDANATSFTEERALQPGDDFQAGTRVAEFNGLPVGETLVRAVLLDSAGAAVAERPLIVALDAPTLATVVMTRDCQDVVCPSGDAPAGATACLGGQCVDPRCTPETPELCPVLCESELECDAPAACGVPVCADGVCLAFGNDAACGPTEYCDPQAGCRADPRLGSTGPACAPSGPRGCLSSITTLTRATTNETRFSSVRYDDQWDTSCGALGSGDDTSAFDIADAGMYEFTFIGDGNAAISVRDGDCDGPELACAVGGVTLSLSAGQRAVIIVESADPGSCIAGMLRARPSL